MNITAIIIGLLRNSVDIRTALGATSANDCPVFATFNFEDTCTKQINVDLGKGKTSPIDKEVHDGDVRVYILVKDTIDEPLKTLNNIGDKVLDVLDLSGSEESSSLYWLQKTDSDFTHYADIHFYELTITFRFVIRD